MQDLKEDKIQEVVIDFNKLRSENLNEGVYSSLGAQIRLAIDAIFGYGFFPVNLEVKGTEKEARAFMKALSSEAGYVRAAKNYGLNNPRTFKSKNILDRAVKGFQKATGLKWPFK
jgi:hypothetical protein